MKNIITLKEQTRLRKQALKQAIEEGIIDVNPLPQSTPERAKVQNDTENAKRIYSVLVPAKVAKEFTDKCRRSGMKQGYVIEQLMASFNPTVSIK